MGWLAATTRLIRRVVLTNSAGSVVTAVRALTSTTPTTTTDPSPAEGEIGVDTSGAWWSFFTANSATNYHRGVCRASGVVTIAAGSTSSAIALGFTPAAGSVILFGCPIGTGGATLTLPKGSLSGSTLTITVDDPTAGSVNISYMVL